ncbi:MAG: hypothetical protein Tsb0013_00380 [Phycisphaerales bacterium]
MLPTCAVALMSLGSFSAVAQDGAAPTDNAAPDPAEFVPFPKLVERIGMVAGEVDVTGETILMEGRRVSRPFCSSDVSNVTLNDLQIWRQRQLEVPEEGTFVFDTTPPGRGGGINLVLNLDASVPSQALPAIAAAEAYVESQFGDPVTIVMDIDFFNFGNGGVIGFASSSSVFVNYTTARSSLIAGMDANDTIQDFLPTGSTVPVRYTSTSTAISNENRVLFNTAAYEATIGSIGGTDASLSFNTQFNFDYDPSNGVNGTCFQSVLIHEIGHGLGFTSNADGFGSDIEVLDLYRFARNDSVNGVNGDWDPDTTAEFQTTARMVDADDPGTSADNDEVDANSDLISVEYRMSDGSPNQASHFNEGLNGIMDPTIGGGQTFFPNFYRTSDLDMFDAIGYDYPPAAPGSFGPLSPPNGATGVSVVEPITWEAAGAAAQYRLRVDNNSNFNSPEIDVTVGTAFTSYTPTSGELQPLTTYFWTVDAINPIGTTTITPSSSTFTTDVAPVGAFALLSPANFAVVSVTPVLDWGDAPNATEYLLEVSTSSLFLSNAIEQTIPAPTSEYSVVPGELAPNTQYFWRVTASNSGSSIGSIPTSSRFTTENTPVNTCVGDFDNDGDVDLGDFGIFGGAFGSMTGDANYDPAADFDNDGDVDLGDFGIFGGEFGRTDCLG